MNLTDDTLVVLKNFASINPNIVVENGNVLKTIAESKTVLAAAEVEETFPVSFGVYDLNEFISVLSLVDRPNLKFEDDYVVISDGSGRSRTKYFYSEQSILTSPKKDIIMPEPEVTFRFDSETLQRVRKASSVLGHDEMSISVIDNSLTLSIIDSNDDTSNAFSIDIDGDFKDPVFNFVFDIRNLKMVDGDYDVAISSKLISHFVNASTSVEYWCALEKNSSYGE